MALIIENENWGAVDFDLLKKLLTTSMRMMDNFYGSKIKEDIIVMNKSSITTPLFLYERGNNNEYYINLTAKDNFFCQYLYQFFHEYCHLRMNCKPGTSSISKWFDESIAELASFFGMLKLSKTWSNIFRDEYLKDYGKEIEIYINKEIMSSNKNLEKGVDFKAWLLININEMERNEYLRDKNAIVANQLLKEFNKNKILWELLTYWNTWTIDKDDDIYDIIKKWKTMVPKKNIQNINIISSILF